MTMALSGNMYFTELNGLSHFHLMDFFSFFFFQVSWSKDKETQGTSGWYFSGQSNIKVLKGNWRVPFEARAATRLPHKEVQCSSLLVWDSKEIQ
jgi:hypothetical protein